jgi:hypothetical protein
MFLVATQQLSKLCWYPDLLLINFKRKYFETNLRAVTCKLIIMDEYNSGMDTEVKLYFRKIMKSFSVFLLWLMMSATFGLFLKLGYLQHGWQWQNTVFYALLILSLAAVIRYLFKLWRKRD